MEEKEVKQQRETGEGQNDDATNRQSNTRRGWHEDGMSARCTDTLARLEPCSVICMN